MLFGCCSGCPVLWVGSFLMFLLWRILSSILCLWSWWMCQVWSEFCICSVPPFSNHSSCGPTLAWYCWCVVLFVVWWKLIGDRGLSSLVFELSCFGYCVRFLLSILFCSPLATILVPSDVRWMLSLPSGCGSLFGYGQFSWVDGVRVQFGDQSVVADVLLVSFRWCWNSIHTSSVGTTVYISLQWPPWRTEIGDVVARRETKCTRLRPNLILQPKLTLAGNVTRTPTTYTQLYVYIGENSSLGVYLYLFNIWHVASWYVTWIDFSNWVED